MHSTHIARPHRTAVLAFALALGCISISLAQSAKPAPAYPTHLPYAFSNFVWWTDADLRAQLKKQIPGLGDEIAPDRATESRIRDALRALLKQKGVTADVMTEDPSPWSLTAESAPGAPVPAIVFSILNPQILVDQVIISGAPGNMTEALSRAFGSWKGREYSNRQTWFLQAESERELQENGYFDSQIGLDHGSPRREGDECLVSLTISITPGPQYHVGNITGDGGPLLEGRDLSTLFRIKPGDVAPLIPSRNLAEQLLTFYEHNGYADAIVEGPPIVDRERALVSYHLTVNPGKLYHLRSLTIHNLDSGQESKVRRLLGIGPGDPFDELAVSSLSYKVRVDSTLNGYTFTFSPIKDKSAGIVDLTLDFSKTTDQPEVTVH